MKYITLVTVNWNQQPSLELLLKSYVKHHYTGKPLKLMLVENGSTDDSKWWLTENEIPFIDCHSNLGHENALNYVYNDIKTMYCLLNDTDIEYHDNVYSYINAMNEVCISAGEMIDNNYIGKDKVRDRISPWFWLHRIDLMQAAGVKYFRDPLVEDWSYDVGSYYWEQMKNLGYTNYNIPRKHWNQDSEIVSMPYEKFDHIGKISWDIKHKHQDRYSEVMQRRSYIKKRLELYKGIDLKGKFIL
jgi:hypothetical protein